MSVTSQRCAPFRNAHGFLLTLGKIANHV
jgi:hypothetical protein